MNNNELNKEGLEYAKSAWLATSLPPIHGKTEELNFCMPNAIRAYLPYHIADVVEENKKLWEALEQINNKTALRYWVNQAVSCLESVQEHSEYAVKVAAQALNLDAQNQPKMNDKEVCQSNITNKE